MEILKLWEMIKKAGWKSYFQLTKTQNIIEGYHIYIPSLKNKEVITLSAVQFPGTYGWNENLIEVYGPASGIEKITDEPIGYLTAEQAFSYFKQYMENSRQ